MKTYEIEYDGSAGPEDAMAGRAWDVIQTEDRTRTVIASRCKSEDAYRIVEGLRALTGIENPASFLKMQRDHVAAQHDSLGRMVNREQQLVSERDEALGLLKAMVLTFYLGDNPDHNDYDFWKHCADYVGCGS